MHYLEPIQRFVRRDLGIPGEPEIRVKPLRGGLDSPEVLQVECNGALKQKARFVVKQLQGFQVREARIYESVLAAKDVEFCPAFLGEVPFQGDTYLFLEFVKRARAWPWREHNCSMEVMRTLAELHQALATDPCDHSVLSEWNYEVELMAAIRRLIEFIQYNRDSEYLRNARRSLRGLRRIHESLPGIRQALFEFAPYGCCIIHGDVHPGNLVLRQKGRREKPVLIDWGRFRMGSALEDVSSWLQSLGFWEPEARRRHDTLLSGYLSARGEPARLTRDLRDAYWLAAACNVLAGAILYHFAIACDPSLTAERRAAGARAGDDCLRIVRRACACWYA